MRTTANLLFIAGAALAGAHPLPSSVKHYSNIKYGFRVSLPAGSNICGSTPPQPNHGILFRPAAAASPPCDDDVESGERFTFANGRYATDDKPAKVAAFAIRECSEMAFDSEGRVSTIPPPGNPGKLGWAACRIDGKDGSMSEILFAYRRGVATNPAVIYTAGMKTNARNYVADHAAFAKWLQTFRLTPLP